MTYTPVDLLEVHAFGRLVGAVGRDPGTGTLVFEYDPEWANTGPELAPIHMPNTGGPYSFPNLNPATFYRLPPLLADSLPDRFGNALIDRWMASRGLSPAQVTPLDRLAYVADRAMGALEYQPSAREDDEAEEPPTPIQLADLVTAARAAFDGDIDTDDEITLQALNELIRVGSSAGGARAKAVIAYNPDTGQIRSGQLSAPKGFSHWIVKLDGVSDPSREFGEGEGYGRIEYAYYLMATEAGIEMTECDLLEEHTRAHFMTRRFDRTPDGGKIHTLTLCGLAHLDYNLKRTHDYAQYLDVIEQLDLGPEALEQAFARIVFNVAAVNCDDHTKNLSFLMTSDGQWSLSPAYDVTYAYNPVGEWTDAHQMTVLGHAESITSDQLLELADLYAVPSPRDALDRVQQSVAQWPAFAEQAGVPEQTAAEIGKSHRDHGLTLG